MNFFEHQDKARRQSRRLVVLFALAVVAIIVAMNALVLAAFGGTEALHTDGTWQASLANHWQLIAVTTGITALVIFGGSAYRTLDLRGGGGRVAQELGGSLVEPDTIDPLRRRLRNVVEEIAIASGVPVPDIYVLEAEDGINAFAAGYSPSDAAVAVTQGTLETLTREELQGVIAHEFSHIFNGDMRLNIRLMGVLFGILVLAVVGRRVLSSMRYSGRNRNAGALVLVGLAVMIIGYVGLFLGRWIRAAVSRQREMLADASAVQFTRNPDSIGGALKKIAASQAGSHMVADTEEVGHMLFAEGLHQRMFATHPPLTKRIRAVDPSFRESELESIARRMARHAEARRAADEPSHPATGAGGGMMTDWVQGIGQPGPTQILAAAALAGSIPDVLDRAAHAREWVPEVVLFLLLDSEDDLRERQLLMIARARGEDSESQTRALWRERGGLDDEARLALLELAFPALRRRSEKEILALLGLVEDLIHADGRVDLFEYALARLTAGQLQDVLRPKRVHHGRERLVAHDEAARWLVSLISRFGDDAAAAFRAGMAEAGLAAGDPVHTVTRNWHDRLDKTLAELDELRPADKERLVRGLVTSVVHDQRVDGNQRALLRVVCAVLHVPLPLAAGAG